MKPTSLFPRRSRVALQAGQAMIEYVLMLGFSAAIGMLFLGSFNVILAQTITGFAATLEKELMVGRYTEAKAQWEN